ncbi:hypothetical protein [Haladaptatus halobius]|uniref:hypothetical protein n=1 Tax=Haladaptatus halobius TaxID=2884875 RepID=UPI001D0A2C8B|nr:hypothetical protein [Haladaptatus halobius]
MEEREFYPHVRTKADVEFETAAKGDAKDCSVLSVYLSIENVAVTSTGEFWNGTKLNHRHREFEKQRRLFQQCGTRAAHETIQSDVPRRDATTTFYTPSQENSSQKSSRITAT